MGICSHCKRSIKGHPKPWGHMCTLEAESVDMEPFNSVNGHKSESDASAKSESHGLPPVFTSTLTHWPKLNMPILPEGSASNPRTYKLIDLDSDSGDGVFEPFHSGDILKSFIDEATPKVHTQSMEKVEHSIKVLTGEMGKMALAITSLASAFTSSVAAQTAAKHHQLNPTMAHGNGIAGGSTHPSIYSTTTSAPVLTASYTPLTFLQQPKQSAKPVNVPTEDVVIGDCVIPRDVAISALCGNYTDLSKFAMSPDPSTDQHRIIVGCDGTVSVSNKLSSKPITDYQKWLTAWSNYEQLLLMYLPDPLSIYNKCAEYKRVIHAAQLEHKWPAVYLYDTKFRVNLAKTKTFNFDVFDSRCYCTTLHAGTLRSDISRCHRCTSTQHRAADCPFREGSKMEKKEKKEEVCFSFNNGKCSSSECERQHVCRYCRSAKPAITCGCKANSSN